jgi:hypothetical protein
VSPDGRLHPRVAVFASLAGFVVAHALGYTLVVPDPSERAHVLAETGHGYLPAVATLGWPLLALAALLALAEGARRRPVRRAVTHRRAGALLAAIQSVFFVVAEVGERLAAHESPAVLLRSPVLPVGLAAQVVVAAAIVLALAAAEWCGRQWSAAWLMPPARPVGQRATTAYGGPSPRLLRTGVAPARGPPGR